MGFRCLGIRIESLGFRISRSSGFRVAGRTRILRLRISAFGA